MPRRARTVHAWILLTSACGGRIGPLGDDAGTRPDPSVDAANRDVRQGAPDATSIRRPDSVSVDADSAVSCATLSACCAGLGPPSMPGCDQAASSGSLSTCAAYTKLLQMYGYCQ
jgi:hypothetical protein